MVSGTRSSPTESATLYKVGVKKKGNDGNIWIISENKNNVKRWKLYKKMTKTTNDKLIKIYDMPFESLIYEEGDNVIKMKNKKILELIPISKIHLAFKKLTNENLLKYYRKYPFDTDNIVNNIKKSKLIFNVYTLENGKICASIFVKQNNDLIIPPKTIHNLKKWINLQIVDGFGENGIYIGNYVLFMSSRRIN